MTATTIDVVVLGGWFASSTTDDYINGAASPTSDVCQPLDDTCSDQTWKLLRAYFQARYQTYGRTVVLHGYTPSATDPEAMAAEVEKRFHPFAVLNNNYDLYLDPYFAKYDIEYFAEAEPSADTDDQRSVLEKAYPFLWSVRPSLDDMIANGAAWVCNSIVGNPTSANPPTRSNDPTLSLMPHRKVALGYETVSSVPLFGFQSSDINAPKEQNLAHSKALADRLAAATDSMCGGGGHVFDQFSCDAHGNCDKDLWIDDNESHKVGGTTAVAADALARMYTSPGGPDTTVVCVFCGSIGYLGNDTFADAEIQAHYFPERLFVAGLDTQPGYARLRNQATFNNAFGLAELWQLPGYSMTYWYRAVNQTDPTATVSEMVGISAYETLMQLFGAIQLSGDALTPGTVQNGMYGWRRGFSLSDDPLLPPASPAAGYTPADHSFVKGMEEELWDSSGTPPGKPYGSEDDGCYRVIDNTHRHSAAAWGGTSPWPRDDLSTESPLQAPCSGDDSGFTVR